MESKSQNEITSVHITVHVAPENAAQYLDIFKDVFATISAEPELRYMEVYQALDNPGIISWVENWNASVEWLTTVQLAKPYYKDFGARADPLYIKEREVKVVKRVEPFMISKDRGQYQGE